MSAPCRVLYIVFDGTMGGSLASVIDLAKYSNRSNLEVTFCLLGKRGATSDAACAMGIEVVSFDAESWHDVKAFFGCLKFLKGRSFDVIHNNARTYFGHLALMLAARKTSKIYQEHGDIHTFGNERACQIFYKVFSGIYDLFLTVGEETMEEMVKVGVPRTRIKNIETGVDFNYFKPDLSREEAKKRMGFPTNSLIIGTACRLAHQKNLSLFLETASHICSVRTDVHFIIAGEGNEEASLRKLAGTLGLQTRVDFIGKCMDMGTLWRAFDIFLFTSHQESFGRTIVESLASGTPIVSVRPDMGGGRILDRAEGVCVIKGRDPKTLGAAALQLCENAGLREELGQKARIWADSQINYKVENWARRVEEVYSELSGKT